MTEVEKLEAWCKEEGCKVSGVTLGPDALAMPEAERNEAVAREINRMHEWMRDPVNALTSSIEGHMFLKGDYIGCTEGRTRIDRDEPYFIPVPPTKDEQRKIDSYRKDNELFRQAVAMLKELKETKELLRGALNEIALETHETIPPDGAEAAFNALERIARITSKTLRKMNNEATFRD